MGNDVKILTVESSPADLNLILEQLEKESIGYSYLNVETKDDFIKGVADFNPDIVLADYSLSSFSGLSAIDLIKELSPLTPVIIVTASNNEETAVECIKKGAEDYILKDHIVRLGLAVRGALENKKLKMDKELDKKKILKLNRTYAVIGQVNEMIVRVRDREKLFEEACKIAVETGKYRLVWVGLLDEINKIIRPHVWTGSEVGFLDEISQMPVDEILRNDPIQNRILMGSYFVCNNIIEEDSGFILRKNGLAHGFHSIISIPLSQRNKVIGSFNIYSDEQDFFNEDEIKLLIEVTDDISYSIDNISKEKAITLSELKYRRLFESAKDGIIILDAETGEIVDVNPFITKNLDYLKEDLIGKHLWEIGFLKDSIFNKDSFLELLELGYIRYENLPLRKKDGTSMSVEFVSNVYGVDNVKVIQCNIRDITERKRTNEQIIMLAQSLRSINECVSITDLEENLIFVNESFLRTYGYNENELIGQNVSLLRSLHNPIDLVNGILPATLLGEWKGELINQKKDGTEFPIYLSTTIITDKDGKQLGLVGVSIDVSGQKSAKKELIEAKEKAESANKLKDAFIANISHEIRTPLNGIIGMTGLIKESFHDSIKPEDEELFEGIDYSTQRLIRTVDLILNYSRMQVGEYPLFPIKINLSSICQHLIKEYSLEAKNKFVEITFQNDCQNSTILADEYSIVMAISNLIGNAIKFSSRGIINVILFINKNNELILEIIDTGIGIDKEYLEKIFEPYRQEQMGYGRLYDGIGLGLALVKKVLELNGAAVSVKSIKGEGATFSVNFGNKVLQDEKKIEIHRSYVPLVSQKSGKASVLIVEDDTINQITIKKYLENDYSTEVTDSSEKVYEILNKTKIDLILMDISILGDKNGLELTKELKASIKYSHIPVIAITAHSSEDDKQNALRSGCDNFLVKPFSKHELLDIINLCLNKSN